MPWTNMDARPRHSLRTITKLDIPAAPGAYAVYRDGERMYIGKAKSLVRRIGNNHNGKGAAMTGSALRRNVAEHLGIATAADIKARRCLVTPEQQALVREWLDACEIAWIECSTEADALQLEAQLKVEFRPPLTKR